MGKTCEQLIDEVKKQIGSLPEKLDAYVQKGDEFYKKGDFDVAAGIYNLAAQIVPSDDSVQEKRLNAIENWLK
jgi:predicted TPR repeat methyltransferase